jgi:hypothetical protein
MGSCATVESNKNVIKGQIISAEIKRRNKIYDFPTNENSPVLISAKNVKIFNSKPIQISQASILNVDNAKRLELSKIILAKLKNIEKN